MPHIHDQIDFTVEVFIVFKNKVLLRKHDKYKMWLSVGGHIEEAEDPNQAALREVKEEVGLDVQLDDSLRPSTMESENYHELIPPYFINRHRISPTHEHVTLTFFATSDTEKLNQTQEGEKSENCQWFTKDELESLPDLGEDIKYYAQKALEVLSQ